MNEISALIEEAPEGPRTLSCHVRTGKKTVIYESESRLPPDTKSARVFLLPPEI